MGKRVRVTAGFLALVLVAGIVGAIPAQAAPQFLSLPFRDNDVILLQGWVSTDGSVHRGIDYVQGTLLSSTWTPFDVVAAADGVAIQSFQGGSNSGFGNFVLIRHDVTDDQGRRLFTLYAHLDPGSINPKLESRSRFDMNYSTWASVEAGEFLGKAGNTGFRQCSNFPNCPHLHFQVLTGKYADILTTSVDPYGIENARLHYPSYANFDGCSKTTLSVWVVCPPDLAPPGPSGSTEAKFDFAVGLVAVDGNIASSGEPDGAFDFFDPFNDGSLALFPTSEFHCLQPTDESGGFLNLRSSDGANRFSPPFLVDNCQLGLVPGSAFLLDDGGGGSVILASFRPDVPLPGQAYGLQLVTLGTEELVNIQIRHCGTGPCVTGLTTFPSLITQTVPTSIDGVRPVILRLVLDDATNEVLMAFSTDGGQTFTTIVLPVPGIVFTSGSSQAFVSVFGSVIE